MQLHVFKFHAMASENEIQLCGDDVPRAAEAARLAIEEVARIERKYSRYRDDSVITRINDGAGKEAIAVDNETAGLLRYADACYQQSGGLFDITSGVLRRAWDFRSPDPQFPDADLLASLLDLVGWRHVSWDGQQIALGKPGMQLDFGGIGKEYAADRAAAVCMEAGMTGGFVNLGGDVRVIGPQADGAPWLIGIAHPRKPGSVMASIALTGGALATSGDYERFFERDGKRYCHILNPRTGYPVEGAQSVSVVAPLCIVAGGLCTVSMLMEEGAAAFLEGQGMPYLLIDGKGEASGSLASLSTVQTGIS